MSNTNYSARVIEWNHRDRSSKLAILANAGFIDEVSVMYWDADSASIQTETKGRSGFGGNFASKSLAEAVRKLYGSGKLIKVWEEKLEGRRVVYYGVKND